MAKAGVLLDGAGLQPGSQGFRVKHDAAGRASVMDGPFAESKELMAGYTLIEVRSHDEAMKKLMEDPRMDPSNPGNPPMPFDVKRMIFGSATAAAEKGHAQRQTGQPVVRANPLI